MLLFIVIWYKRGYFNTSHVTVYLFGLSVLYFFDSFQYIPCYCLSISKIILKIKHFYFNTSHVTVYPQCIRNLPHFLFISIHPMLLFITEATRRAIYKYEFQYIPCYCLSQRNRGSKETGCKFQYIPCYCLSQLGSSASFSGSAFQYIPCYCLSY